MRKHLEKKKIKALKKKTCNNKDNPLKLHSKEESLQYFCDVCGIYPQAVHFQINIKIHHILEMYRSWVQSSNYRRNLRKSKNIDQIFFRSYSVKKFHSRTKMDVCGTKKCSCKYFNKDYLVKLLFISWKQLVLLSQLFQLWDSKCLCSLRIWANREP